MKAYKNLSTEELQALLAQLESSFEDAKGKGLDLNMARGKPSVAQLNMCTEVVAELNKVSDYITESGVDCRNYGELTGIYEAKKLMGDLMGVPAEQVIVCGNSSLNIMYDTISRSVVFGVNGNTPWSKLDKVKFLCPVPGYDRHFAITELFGIEMINIPMTAEGPDMDMVREYVENDEAVKGIWCVPKYSNPSGITYSDDTVRAFASLKPAAKDFRIFWDNAYVVHDLYEDKKDTLLEILAACKEAGNEDMVYEFSSTSKITFAGAGIAAVASSQANLNWMTKTMTIQTISYDKINQLRHVRFFNGNVEGIYERMSKLADFMRPKFDALLQLFDEELDGLEIGTWTRPNGGYFISFDAMEGCAKEIVAKCKEAGVTLTGAGATFPYGKDPKDSNIRIAPSYPELDELMEAAKIFILCVKLVSVKKLLSK